jgi:type III secretory pathway component EscS
MTIVRILISVIHAILQVIAAMLTSGIALLATALTIVLVAAALGAGSFSGLETLHHIRKREKAAPEPDDPA